MMIIRHGHLKLLPEGNSFVFTSMYTSLNSVGILMRLKMPAESHMRLALECQTTPGYCLFDHTMVLFDNM